MTAEQFNSTILRNQAELDFLLCYLSYCLLLTKYWLKQQHNVWKVGHEPWQCHSWICKYPAKPSLCYLGIGGYFIESNKHQQCSFILCMLNRLTTQLLSNTYNILRSYSVDNSFNIPPRRSSRGQVMRSTTLYVQG